MPTRLARPRAVPAPLSDHDPEGALVERELAALRLRTAEVLNARRSHRHFFRWIGAILVVAVGALFLPWQQNVNGEGTVTALRPQDRPQLLPAVIDGRIEAWHVREGEFVRAGQPVARLAEIKEDYLDPALVERTAEQRDAKAAAVADKRAVAGALAQQAEVLERALALKLDQTRNKIVQYEAQVRAASADSAVAVDQLHRRQGLATDGLVSTNDLQSATLKAQKAAADLAEKRAALGNASIDLAASVAEYQEKIVKARADRAKTLAEVDEGTAEVAKLRNKVASLEIRRGFYELRAPQDGYVVQARRAGLGETVKAGEAVVTVVPARPRRAVELYVKPVDVPLLRTGDRVRLQFDGWPALQFSGWPSVSVGTFGGRVAVVDRVSSPGGKFRVLVTPDAEDEPWPAELRMGTGVYGWAMLREVRVWYELWRRLNGFPPSVAPPSPGGAKAPGGAYARA